MHFKKRMQQGISMALITAVSLGNVVGVYANTEMETTADTTQEVNTQNYQAQANLADESVALDAALSNEPANTPSVIADTNIQIIRGNTLEIPTPAHFEGEVTWSAKFLKNDGTFLRNSGYQKIKRELKEGEVDGNRKAGDASASHLLDVTQSPTGALLTAKNKGNVVVVAQDSKGQTQQWNVEILYQDPAKLPTVTDADFAKIRQTWVESLIGKNVAAEQGGAEILEAVSQEAETAWNSYAYKGQDKCTGTPWKEDEGAKGNPNIPYVDDAVEFRPAYKKVLAMTKAYAMEGSRLYHNQEMLKDIINILDYLSTECYVPKSQTDNWWTWEIGIPKDLIPALMLIHDDLTPEQIQTFTDGLYFFQPDPFHEGVINTASTHGQGYRVAQGANIIDCSTTAVGLGALRKDNELVYLGMLASSQTFTIHMVQNSAEIAQTGYESGFYPDGSYLDHDKVPYLGAYGIEFMKGAVRIPSLLAGTPWVYPPEVQKNLESYVVEGFGNGIYRGMMLDSLKGRSVSRPASSNRAAGRDAMAIILQMVDSFSPEAKSTTLSSLKYWLQEDAGFMDTLTGAENLAVKQKAQAILNDDSIKAYVAPMHKSYALMDRAIHRTNDYLFAVSMYSERIQNSEIMNHENRFGWHQNNGMTYIYDKDDQYTENYWNTVNPLRLAGTTVVPVNMGNGKPDSSGFAQGGDFCSDQSWVGGSSIGNYGISGMAFSGVSGAIPGDGTVTYAPDLSGKKSWFMFDDEIVCLGAGITNQGMDLPVETTIENKKLNPEGSNQFVVDGKETKLPVQEANIKELVDRSVDVSGTKLENVKWAHLAGTEAVGTGYYFPEANTNIQVRHGKTTGDWKDVGTFDGESTQNYLEMWFDHGANPTNAAYSYVLLPEKTQEQTQKYAQNPNVVILENTANIQAVSHNGLQIAGINFWNENGGKLDKVESNKAASVMLQITPENTVKVAVSDPTMKNAGTIQITLHEEISEAVNLDSNVTVAKNADGATVLTFNMANTNGASSMAELKLPTHTDKTQLKSTVDKAQALKAEDYTPESWKAVQTALEQAVAVLGENNSTQEQVTQAAQALQSAMDTLILKADANAAQAVQNSIDKIGVVTLESKSAIQNARNAYNALSDAQKKLVTNYDKLVQAEAELKKLEEAQKPTPDSKPNPTPAPANPTTNSPIVQTGDTSPIALLCMAVASAVAMVTALWKRKEQ